MKRVWAEGFENYCLPSIWQNLTNSTWDPRGLYLEVQGSYAPINGGVYSPRSTVSTRTV